MSDTELFAAYCGNYFNQARALANMILAQEKPCADVQGLTVSCAQIANLERQASADLQEKQDRVKRYLLGRGIPTSRASTSIVIGLTAAKRQAEADFQACLHYMQEKGQEKAMTFGQCTKLWRCLSALPF